MANLWWPKSDCLTTWTTTRIHKILLLHLWMGQQSSVSSLLNKGLVFIHFHSLYWVKCTFNYHWSELDEEWFLYYDTNLLMSCCIFWDERPSEKKIRQLIIFIALVVVNYYSANASEILISAHIFHYRIGLDITSELKKKWNAIYLASQI